MSPSTRRRRALRRPAGEDPTRRRSAGDQSERSTTFRGRLVFPTGHGPRSIIVECHRAADGFLIRLPEFNDAANYLTDTPVDLTSESSDGSGPVAAAITGHSQVIPDQDVDAAAVSALERWPAGVHAHYFRITPSGRRSHEDRRISSRTTHPPAVERPSAPPRAGATGAGTGAAQLEPPSS